MKRQFLTVFVVIMALTILAVVALPFIAQAGTVSVQWDHNATFDPAQPDYEAPATPGSKGYKVFMRTYNDGVYDYEAPIWTGEENKALNLTIPDNRVLAFVVRAYIGDLQSADSDEVTYIYLTGPTNVIVGPYTPPAP